MSLLKIGSLKRAASSLNPAEAVSLRTEDHRPPEPFLVKAVCRTVWLTHALSPPRTGSAAAVRFLVGFPSTAPTSVKRTRGHPSPTRSLANVGLGRLRFARSLCHVEHAGWPTCPWLAFGSARRVAACRGVGLLCPLVAASEKRRLGLPCRGPWCGNVTGWFTCCWGSSVASSCWSLRLLRWLACSGWLVVIMLPDFVCFLACFVSFQPPALVLSPMNQGWGERFICFLSLLMNDAMREFRRTLRGVGLGDVCFCRSKWWPRARSVHTMEGFSKEGKKGRAPALVLGAPVVYQSRGVSRVLLPALARTVGRSLCTCRDGDFRSECGWPTLFSRCMLIDCSWCSWHDNQGWAQQWPIRQSGSKRVVRVCCVWWYYGPAYGTPTTPMYASFWERSIPFVCDWRYTDPVTAPHTSVCWGSLAAKI